MKNFINGAIASAFFAVGSVAALPAIAGSHAWAPEGPIKLVIAFAAGGGADTQARLIAEQIQESTGWEIIPEQLTGKGGVNALVALKDMPADGTAIAMVVTESLGYNAVAADGAGVTPVDFTPLATTAGFQMGIVAKSDKGWNSLNDMLEAAKGGTDIRFGTMSPRLADIAFLLGEANGVEFNIVEVRGGKAVMNGVNAGDMDVGFMAGIQAKGVAAGELVNLASALSVPLQQTPDAPVIADFGVPFSADGYFVFVAPGGLPDDAREAITNAIVEASNTGAAGEMIGKAFGGTANITGADLDSLLAAEYDSAGALIEAAQ